MNSNWQIFVRIDPVLRVAAHKTRGHYFFVSVEEWDVQHDCIKQYCKGPALNRL
jgi:hypothetical protein